jgi:hypothetical protein
MHASLIADLCNPETRRTFAGFANYVTPFDMLDWYAEDMDSAKREAQDELLGIEMIENDLRMFRYPPITFTSGPQSNKRILCAISVPWVSR